jgi:predicted peroxiredoxin
MLWKNAAAAALAVGFAASASAQEAPDLVTVVTSDQPQVQLMSMVLSMQAMEQGESVHMLLCGAGGDLALSDAPESATAPQPPRDMSPQGLMTALIERGATVEVCAIYLPGLGADESVLIDGVGVAQPPAMAGAMLGEDTTVWSF